jgi:hypothetical protein
MSTGARKSLAVVCFFLGLYGVIFGSLAMTHKRTIPAEADYWQAAGCDELCLQQKNEANGTPRVSVDFSDPFR